MKRAISCVGGLVSIALWCGCDAGTTPPAANGDGEAARPVAVEALGIDGGGGLAADPAGAAAAPAESAEAAEPATEPEMVREVAEAGVGVEGQSLEGEGIGTTAARAYFSVRQRSVFEIQIPQAMKLYEATNGESPQSHDDFMEKIVKANRIQLPKLPANHKYVYDVENEQLMVEHPK